MRLLVRLTLPLILMFLGATLIVQAQAPQDPPANPPPLTGMDVAQQLALSPEQVRRIREIQRDTRDERNAIGMRMRLANRALQEALDAPVLDDNLVEQRIQDFAAAQNSQLRLRIQTEIRIRRLLNPSQLATLRDLRLQVGDVIRAQDGNRANRPANNGLRPNQRNGLAPRGNQPIRNPRP